VARGGAAGAALDGAEGAVGQGVEMGAWVGCW
jgi:hypothetical protein